ncbi:MAG: outer membrane lipoprotein chaperone LolA [Betaproteobacteria bacterium]
MRFRIAAGLALALAWPVVHAGGIDELHAFLANAKNGKATFQQSVTARSGRAPQVSSGAFAFARPGKFRWSYEKPYEQLVVGDGAKVWVFDKDLNQVIVRPLDAALGATPAALLAGDNTLERNFTLIDAGAADGLAWVEATPKAAESSFTKVRIGLRGALPRAMELTDAFGQTTRLAFDAFERNVALDAALFRFTPPPGADVVTAPSGAK